MITDFFYVTLLIFAILAIQSGILRKAIIYLCVFSLLSSVVYLLLGAPDVAIAEAVIGCTLSTILYLVALKQYRIYSVYYRCDAGDLEELPHLKNEQEQMRRIVTQFVSAKELQMDFVHTAANLEQLYDSASYDIILIHSKEGFDLYGLRNSYQYTELSVQLKEKLNIPVYINYINEEGLDESSNE